MNPDVTVTTNEESGLREWTVSSGTAEALHAFVQEADNLVRNTCAVTIRSGLSHITARFTT
jgi:hypothetical protein